DCFGSSHSVWANWCFPEASWLLQNRNRHIRPGARVTVGGGAFHIRDLAKWIAEMPRNRLLALPETEHHLHQPLCADGMPACEQAAAGIDGIFSADARRAALDESPGLAVLAQAHVLVLLQLGGGIRIVQLPRLDFLARI